MVFHEDEGEEGGRTETAVAQDEENEEVRGGEGGEGGRGRQEGTGYTFLPSHTFMSLPSPLLLGRGGCGGRL